MSRYDGPVSGYNEEELEKALSTDTRAELIANTLREHLPAFGKVKAIAFCTNVGHARFMARALTRRGHEAACVLGDTPETKRREVLSRLRNESDSLTIVCAVDVLSEGIDVPALTHVMLLRPTQSFTVFMQQLGRGLRLYPRKDFLLVLDFVGNFRNNYVVPLTLSGHVPGDGMHLLKGILRFTPPRECYILPDTKVREIWHESIRTKFERMNTKDRLKKLYEEIWSDLGRTRSPRIMDFVGHPLCDDPLKFVSPSAFGNWLRTKEYCGGLSAAEKAWINTPAEIFLQHIERELSPVKSYKMAVLLTLLEIGTSKTSWTIENIAERFKAYYVESPLRLRDYNDLARFENPDTYPISRVVSHIKRMPLKYLSDKPEKFFTLEDERFTLKSALHPYWAQVGFHDSLRDRIHFALVRYWARKYTDDPVQKLSIPTKKAAIPDTISFTKQKLEILSQPDVKIPKPMVLSFVDVRDRAFRSALPFVADMAAGSFRDSFEFDDLNAYEALDWVEVPPRYCRDRRFVIRVAGNSMAPEFHIGDLLVFEYHRTPRRTGEIVIAADFSLGETASEYAIKRVRADEEHWIFESTNPDYTPPNNSKERDALPNSRHFCCKTEIRE